MSYLRNAVAKMLKFHVEDQGNEFELVLLCNTAQRQAMEVPDGIKVTIADTAELSGYRRSLWERRNLPEVARENNTSAIFTPYQMINSSGGARNIVMVRNMEPFFFDRYPYAWQTKIRNMLLRRITVRTLSSADRVIAVSQFVEDFLVDDLDLSRNNIQKIYHGRDTGFADCDDNSVGQKLGMFETNKKFLFACGSMLPYRRNEDIITAFDRIRNHFEGDLVIAGDGDDSRYKKTLQRLCRRLELSERVHFVGHVTLEQMKWLYRNCVICVLCSEVEACPNIAIEAMTAGCCIVSSSYPPLPEILGTNATKSYPSRDTEKLAATIQSLLDSPESRRSLSSLARERAENFSWDRCAEQTYQFLREQV